MSNEKTTPAANDVGYADWADVATPKNNNNSNSDATRLAYLTITEGEQSRVRLIGHPYPFKKHYKPIRATSPGLEEDVCWQAGNVPGDRYIIHVLDRNDDNQIKLLEGGSLLFGVFKNYYTITGNEPGGAVAPDFVISKEVPMKDGKKDFRSTKYPCMNLEAVALTAEEQTYIDENALDLKEKIKPTDPAIIAEMFEDSKTRSNEDPIPGTKEWWSARRERRVAQGDAAPAPASDGAGSGPSIPGVDAEGSAESGESFQSIFDEGSKEKSEAGSTAY